MSTTREKMLLTVAEVAELLTVSTRTVWAWVADGTLPEPMRKGKRWTRWRRKDVEAFLEGR